MKKNRKIKSHIWNSQKFWKLEKELSLLNMVFHKVENYPINYTETSYHLGQVKSNQN